MAPTSSRSKSLVLCLALSVTVALGAALALGLGSSVVARPVWADAAAAPALYTLQGRVLEGTTGTEPTESSYIKGVKVSLWCSNNAGDKGIWLVDDWTDENGLYQLDTQTICEYYNIIETNPPGYVSDGAKSVDGFVINADWIQYRGSLAGKTLTGNKFWDKLLATNTPTVSPTPSSTPTTRPTDTPTQQPTKTPTSTSTPERPTNTPTPTPTGVRPTNTPTSTPTRTPTGRVTPTPTSTPTSRVTPTPTPTATGGAAPPPVTFPPGDWPWYAQEEITVDPYPVEAGRPTEICVELRNPADVPQDVQVQFSWAAFGIGMPFTPIDGLRPVHLPPHSLVKTCIMWVPPFSGHVCLQVELFQRGAEPQRSLYNADVSERLVPGQPHTLTFPVGNPLDHVATITLGLIPHVEGWGFELYPNVLAQMQPGEVREVHLTVTPPAGAPLPPDGTVIVDVEAFADGELIGGFRKIFRPPVILHPFPDPTYAEHEITVHPYPVRAGEPTEICVELRNPTDTPQDVQVQFSWAAFGIGIPFTPIDGQRPVHLPPHSVVKTCINWIPPIGGHVCLQAELFQPGTQPQRSQTNIDVAEPLRLGVSHSLTFPVGNPFSYPVTVTLGLIPHLDGWHIKLSQDVLPNMKPGEVREVTLTVTPPADAPLPPDGALIVDVEAYVGRDLIGGFRKIFRPPVILHPFPDPTYAEREITVHPYPPKAGQPTEICVELRNPTDTPQDVQVQFAWANFGIGIPFTPIDGQRPVHLPAYSTVKTCIMWIPPAGGHFCLQAELFQPGTQPQRSQHNIDVAEPLTPGVAHSLTFPVGNPFSHPVTVTLGLIPHLDGWHIKLSQDVLPNMKPGEVREVTLTVTPPAGAPLPPDGTVIVDVEAYVDGQLIGGFRKVFRPPVPIHRPKDPVYAESEISVDPYPAIAGAPTKLGVELFNPTAQDQIVKATFSVAPFGIGLPFETTHITPNPINIFVPKFGAARGYVIWQPPDWAGRFCVRVTLEMEGYAPIWSQRNIDVGEPLRPGVPHSLTFPVGNPLGRPVTITLGLISHRTGLQASLSPNTLVNVQPGHPLAVTLMVTQTVEGPRGTGKPLVDVEAYVDGELIGGFRKMDVPPVAIHKPHEKVYAESEIIIDPDPPQAGQDTQVSAVVQNNGDDPVTVNLEFGWAAFGMGIPFTTTQMTPHSQTVTVSPGMTQTATVTWKPIYSGHQCVRVFLSDAEGLYERQESMHNVEVAQGAPCGQTKTFTFTVYNDSALSVVVDIGTITFNVPADWVVIVEPSGTLTIGPHSSAKVTVTVLIPCPATLQALDAAQAISAMQEQAGGLPTIDVEAYIEGELVGGIELRFTDVMLRPNQLYLPVILRQQR
jgi:hypothetical protein